MAVVLEFMMDDAAIRALREGPAMTKAGKSRKRLGRSLERRIKDHNFSYDGFLRMPVRLSVNEKDLFSCGGVEHPLLRPLTASAEGLLARGHPLCPWLWAPVVYMATQGLLAVERVESCGSAQFRVAELGVLSLQGHDGTVDISWSAEAVSSRYQSRAVATIQELTSSWSGFSARVRERLLAAVPELASHREYGAWLVGGRAYLHNST